MAQNLVLQSRLSDHAASTAQDGVSYPRPALHGPSHHSHDPRQDASSQRDNEVELLELPNQEPANVAYVEDTPPNGGYGWVCTACIFLINANTWGINGAWGVFLNYYLSNVTFPGATRLEFALIGGLSMSQSFIISPAVSLSNTYLGTRITLLIGTALVFLALFIASFATSLWHLFVTQGVCFGFGIGFLYMTATAVLPPWFSTRRSLAIGFASAGAGFGGLFYSLVAGYAISSLGVQNAYRILASSTLVVNLASSLLLKDRTRRRVPQQKIFSYRDLGQIEILLVVFWGTVTELGYITLLYSLPNYASSVGLNPTQGSIAGALLNLGQGFGRPIVGYCSDAFGRINMAMCMTTFCAVLCFSLWIPATTYGPLLAFALLSGTACGTFWGTIAPVLADVTGLKNFASTFGMICFSLVLPATFAEPIAIQLLEAPTVGSGQYLHAQIYTGFMFLAGGLSLWILRSWKINEVDEKAQIEQLLEQYSGRESALQPAIKPSWAFLKKILVLRNV